MVCGITGLACNSGIWLKDLGNNLHSLQSLKSILKWLLVILVYKCLTGTPLLALQRTTWPKAAVLRYKPSSTSMLVKG